MNNYKKFSIICFICGLIFFIMGIIEGKVEVGFFLFFPFLIGYGFYAFFGFILFFFSILLFMFGFYRSTTDSIDLPTIENRQNKKIVKGGGVILIGPIPIIFGSNRKIIIVMVVLAVLLIIFYFLLLKIFSSS